MSTLKATNLQHASAASPAIVLAADGSATAQLSSINGGPLAGSRNRIINGDMRIDQRNAGASVSVSNAAGTYIVDRFFVYEDTAAALSGQQGNGPDNSLKNMSVTVGTAGSATAAQLAQIQHRIEGQNVHDFLYGTANAVNSVLSFWVQSSVTGTYCVGLRNGAQNRSYVAEYTISAANTWEKKTISIPGDTTGTWAIDNGAGITVTWDLGSGSNFNGTSVTWQAASVTRTTNQVNWINNSGAIFRLSGVQLEPGTVATPFERRSYGQELALCQRYYEILSSRLIGSASVTTSNVMWSFKATKRAAPTVTLVGSTGANNDIGVDSTGLFVSNSQALFGIGTSASSEL